jgi:hypothetical protein
MDTNNAIYLCYPMLLSIDDTIVPASRFPIRVQLFATAESFHSHESPTDVRQEKDGRFV